MVRRFVVLWAAFSFLTVSAIAAQLPTGKVEIFPLDQLRPGMKGVAYTVFEGTQAEPFDIEVVGLLKNAWGPRQHIILIKVGGRAAKTGVAAGMSGSPVYIDGKLLGALSLRIGAFPNEPIAGVTPAELMLDINEKDGTRPQVPSTMAASKLPLPAEIRSMLNPAIVATAGDAYMTPIETPLVLSGFNEGVLQQFADTFRQMGVTAVVGGASSDLKAEPITTDPEKLKASMPPGAPISGVLVAGDLSIAGSGTVTYNDGRRVLAFGHPFFNAGKVDMPMATAEVVTTLGSTFAPFKLMNANEVVGVLRQDRHSGIMGVLGEAANMIPVEIKVHSGAKDKAYHFQIFQNAKFTPFVLILTTFNALAGINEYGEDLTYRMKTNIELDGFPEVKLEQMYAPPENAQTPAPLFLSFWVGDRFGRIFLNPYETPKIKGVKLDFDLLPERRTAILEHVWMERNEVRPGEEIAARVFLRPYRGERVAKDLKFRIPLTAPKGDLRIQFSDAEYVNRFSSFLLQQNRAPGLSEIVSLLNRERSNGQLYVTLLQTTPTAYLEDKVMPSIPSSMASVIDPGRVQGRLTIMGETALQQEAIPLDYVISGVQTLTVTVK